MTGEQQQHPAYKPELIEFMIFTQIRHAKLWLAGNAGNWELADYEIDELKEVLENAAKHVPDYKGMPVGKMIELVALAPIEDVEKAIKAKDRARFVTAYDQLTAACNTCISLRAPLHCHPAAVGISFSESIICPSTQLAPYIPLT